jgi:hypothetical protein
MRPVVCIHCKVLCVLYHVEIINVMDVLEDLAASFFSVQIMEK